jgi:hypothetical protein
MKKDLTQPLAKGLFLLVIFSALAQGQSQMNTQTTTVQVTPEIVRPVEFSYSPHQSAILELTGHYPNACYQPAHPQVTVDTLKKEIHIIDYASIPQDRMCAAVLTPYERFVTLPPLTHGTYLVFIRQKDGSSKEMAKLHIRP